MSYKNLFLVRHGQTTMNIQGIYQGRLDSDLTKLGKKQTENLGEYIKSKGIIFDDIYCSDSPRAIKTCEIVLKSLKNIFVEEIHYDNRLAEMDFGVFEGQSIKLCQKKYSKTYFDFYNNPKDYKPSSNGESIYQVINRVSDFLSDLEVNNKGSDNILIVTHGVVIRTILYCIFNRNIEDFWIDGEVPSSSLTIINRLDSGMHKINELFTTCY